MGSSLAWLDSSERERRRVLDVLAMFRERDTRDELGINSIRDAFANMLFPGTGTLQTRARYFLFVPWIYQLIERNLLSGHTSREEIAKSLREREHKLRRHLCKLEKTGVIGSQAGDRLLRFPSSIYWLGLEAWGIRLVAGSQDAYHRTLGRLSSLGTRSIRDGDDDTAVLDAPRFWHGFPPAPKNFPEGASFSLTGAEADYLRDRVLSRHSGALIAWLLENGHGWDDVKFPWDLQSLAEMPPALVESLHHARSFSELMQGAALLYNLMLAELAGQEDRITGFRERFGTWSALVEQRWEALSTWRLDLFWRALLRSGARVPPATSAFVASWVGLVRGASRLESLAAGGVSRDLITRREQFLKRSRARLTNRRALELWGGDAGTRQLDYRWAQAKVIIRDILQGLSEGEDCARAAR